MGRPMRIELVSESGKNIVRLELGEYFMHLGPNDVVALVEQLGAFRASMLPRVARSVSPTHKYSIEVNPCWYAEPHPTSDAVVLFLRDTGVGWIGFSIPRDKALRLCDELGNYTNASNKPLGLAS